MKNILFSSLIIHSLIDLATIIISYNLLRNTPFEFGADQEISVAIDITFSLTRLLVALEVKRKPSKLIYSVVIMLSVLLIIRSFNSGIFAIVDLLFASINIIAIIILNRSSNEQTKRN